MSIEKNMNTRIQHKHDIEANWSKATNFIPKVGEIIIYDIDENNSIARFKIGDGITNVNSLPFVSHHEVISYLPQELTEEQKAQARENIGAGEPQIQADWNQNDETALDYIKNRTHYEETAIETFEREIETAFSNAILDIEYSFETIPMYIGQVLELYYIGTDTNGEYATIGTFTVVEENDELIAYHDDGSQMYITENTISIVGSFGYNAGVTSVKIVGEAPVNIIHRIDKKYLPENIQSDWLQNDSSQLDYIKNRTHYDDTIYTLRTRQDINNILNDMGISYGSSTAEIIPGITFRVIIDGVVYDNVPIWSGCYCAGGYTWGIGDGVESRGNKIWHSTDYGFCFCGYSDSPIVNNDIFPNDIESFEVYTVEKDFKYLDPKYIKDMYHEIPEVVTTLHFDEDWGLDSYPWKIDNAYTLRIDGIIYRFDGFEYGFYHGASGYDFWYLGTKPGYMNGSNQAPENWDESPYPFSIYGPIYYGTNDLRYAYIHFKDGTTNHTVEIIESEAEIKYIDPKYIKDMYYDNGITITEVVPETTIEIGQDFPTELNLNNITVGNTYIVIWNGELYECVCYQYMNAKVIGNANDFDGVGGNGEPFCIANFDGITQVMALEAGTYTISITERVHDLKQLDIKYLPIIKEGKKVVFEMDDVESGNMYENDSYQKFTGGEYIVTVDGISEIINFIEYDIDTDEVSESEPNDKIFVGTWDGGIFIEFSDGGTHLVKIEKIIEVIDDKYLPESAKVQPDWNQNDENAPDYIKNRTHYITEKLTLLKDPLTVDCNTATTYDDVNCYVNGNGFYAYWLGWGYLEGQTIRIVFDGESYDILITDFRFMASLKSYPFRIEYVDRIDRFYVYTLKPGTHTLEFYSIDHVFKQLDPRYVGTNWNQSDKNAPGYIENRTHYEEEIGDIITATFTSDGSYYKYTMSYDERLIYQDLVENRSTVKIRVNDSDFILTSNGFSNGYYRLSYDGYYLIESYIGGNTSNILFFHPSTLGLSEDEDSYTVYIYDTQTVVHQLDEKYIPDTIMRTPTEDDALELVAELGLAEPMTDDEGKVLTDENGILFIL